MIWNRGLCYTVGDQEQNYGRERNTGFYWNSKEKDVAEHNVARQKRIFKSRERCLDLIFGNCMTLNVSEKTNVKL
jgi:hypothetical protein